MFSKATRRQRRNAFILFCVIAAGFLVLSLAGFGVIDLGRYIAPCGFKQRHDLPCPTCGMTTASAQFASGHVLRAFYIQPAAGFFCSILFVVGFLSFITAVFGVYFSSLGKAVRSLKIRYVIGIIVLVILAGWAVTLARAFAAQQNGW